METLSFVSGFIKERELKKRFHVKIMSNCANGMSTLSV